MQGRDILQHYLIRCVKKCTLEHDQTRAMTATIRYSWGLMKTYKRTYRVTKVLAPVLV